MCGMGSFRSMIKRWAWFMGGCCCIKTPVPAEDTLGSQEFCSELRERFNPLRHKSVADRLPPPRRFRINENFLSYTSAADDKGASWSAVFPRLCACLKCVCSVLASWNIPFFCMRHPAIN